MLASHLLQNPDGLGPGLRPTHNTLQASTHQAPINQEPIFTGCPGKIYRYGNWPLFLYPLPLLLFCLGFLSLAHSCSWLGLINCCEEEDEPGSRRTNEAGAWAYGKRGGWLGFPAACSDTPPQSYIGGVSGHGNH